MQHNPTHAVCSSIFQPPVSHSIQALQNPRHRDKSATRRGACAIGSKLPHQATQFLQNFLFSEIVSCLAPGFLGKSQHKGAGCRWEFPKNACVRSPCLLHFQSLDGFSIERSPCSQLGCYHCMDFVRLSMKTTKTMTGVRYCISDKHSKQPPYPDLLAWISYAFLDLPRAWNASAQNLLFPSPAICPRSGPCAGSPGQAGVLEVANCIQRPEPTWN